MKDKLVKRNLTSYDYKIRRLGAISTFMMLASTAVIVPIYQQIAKQNKLMIAEIAEKTQKNEQHDLPEIEIKKISTITIKCVI